jgi:hypothetical protein
MSFGVVASHSIRYCVSSSWLLPPTAKRIDGKKSLRYLNVRDKSRPPPLVYVSIKQQRLLELLNSNKQNLSHSSHHTKQRIYRSLSLVARDCCQQEASPIQSLSPPLCSSARKKIFPNKPNHSSF